MLHFSYFCCYKYNSVANIHTFLKQKSKQALLILPIFHKSLFYAFIHS